MNVKQVVVEKLTPFHIGQLLIVETFDYADIVERTTAEKTRVEYVGKLKWYRSGPQGYNLVFDGVAEVFTFKFSTQKVNLYSYERSE